MARREEGQGHDAGSRLKSIIGGSAGNLMEWYDWYVYAAFALYFAPAIFPAEDRTTQLLSAAAIFAIGFIMPRWARGSWAGSPMWRDASGRSPCPSR